jgi:hypothetical protein
LLSLFRRHRDILSHDLIPARVAGDESEDEETTSVLEDQDRGQFDTGNATTPARMRNAAREHQNDLQGVSDVTDERDGNDPELVENGMGPDLSLTEMMNDILALKITKYFYLDSNGCIGGTSSGPARIQFNEIYDESVEGYVREITPCRIRRAVNGGQIYMPMMLQLLNVNQRKPKHIEELRGFPMLMLRTLLTRSGSVDDDKKVLYNDLIKMHELITILISDCKMSMKTMSSHPVRIELYFASTLQSDECDVEFPKIDWKKIISTINHQALKKNWMEGLGAFNDPIEKVIAGVRTLVQPGSTRTPMLEVFTAPVKTMLVFCAERLIAMMNIRGFDGRVIRCLKGKLEGEAADRTFWTVPEDDQVFLEDDEMESSGLPWGLSPDLLCLPGVNQAFISQKELRTTPPYLEQFNGQLYSDLTIPIGYFRYRLRVKVLFLKNSSDHRPSEQARINYGVFDDPSYTAIALLPDNRRNRLLSELTEVLSYCYVAEWWFLITDRMKSLKRRGMYPAEPGHPNLCKLEDFPRTKGEFEQWMRRCNEVHFLTRSRMYVADLAEVTDVDDFIRMAFLDTAPTPDVGCRSNWDRCIARRMMHLICSELLKVENLAANDVKPHFSLAAFEKRVAIHFSSELQSRHDVTQSIMWKTNTTSSMYSWDEFSPVLVNISENPVPSVARASIFAAPMETGRGRPMFDGKMVKDTFYRNIVKEDCLRPVQLNQLILYRCVLWLQLHEEVVPNQKQIKVHHRRFPIGRMGKGLLYDVFFEDKQMIELAAGMIKAMKKPRQKEKDLKVSAEINKSLWPSSGGLSDIDMFLYGSEAEHRMNGYLDTGNYGDAFVFAQMGYVTKRFLVYFFGVRKVAIERMHAGESLSRSDCAAIAGY